VEAQPPIRFSGSRSTRLCNHHLLPSEKGLALSLRQRVGMVRVSPALPKGHVHSCSPKQRKLLPSEVHLLVSDPLASRVGTRVAPLPSKAEIRWQSGLPVNLIESLIHAGNTIAEHPQFFVQSADLIRKLRGASRRAGSGSGASPEDAAAPPSWLKRTTCVVDCRLREPLPHHWRRSSVTSKKGSMT
jgi:hypothetical protein